MAQYFLLKFLKVLLSFFIGILSSTRLFSSSGLVYLFLLISCFFRPFIYRQGITLRGGSAYGRLVMRNTNMGIDGSVNWEFHLHDFIFCSLRPSCGFIFIY